MRIPHAKAPGTGIQIAEEFSAHHASRAVPEVQAVAAIEPRAPFCVPQFDQISANRREPGSRNADGVRRARMQNAAWIRVEIANLSRAVVRGLGDDRPEPDGYALRCGH